ncbi:conserved hypothetical protein [Anaeromyxobacter dehalogenans 2CP-1]|uniref:Tetrahaem cytochrome domain-containing protein n=1 Tax=Anaeromyxobacter dehalogenans (strain ATCC BAA-258 / DSM 21875 / 2CP-1) TaxID=455488 RepID=B8J6N8_ANAD2|nr:cytochrome c3 family protein [Anaeromyxobacter dehalogenans]ACL67010.1 conserved hypothetical protein [Anaeromyxobacter dehalogenans 2CP-1]
MNWMSRRKLFALSLASLLGGLVAAQASAADAVTAATPKAAPAAQAKADALARVHAAAGVKCAQCHVKAAKAAPVEMDRCVSCHPTKALAVQTAGVKPRNPHENRHYGTELDCNACHHQHRQSENFCLPCHNFAFQVP